MHLGTRSYYGTRVRVFEVMQNKTTSTMQQGIGTNHKNLQVHENNPKSLQKQHGYQKKKQTQYTEEHLKYININQSITAKQIHEF